MSEQCWRTLRIKHKVRPFTPRERHVVAARKRNGILLWVFGVAPSDPSVLPGLAVTREGVATACVQPPVVRRVLSVHVMEKGMVVAVLIQVQEGIFGARVAQICGHNFIALSDIRRDVTPVTGASNEDARPQATGAIAVRTAAYPFPPQRDQRAIWQNQRRKVHITANIMREYLLRRGPRTFGRFGKAHVGGRSTAGTLTCRAVAGSSGAIALGGLTAALALSVRRFLTIGYKPHDVLTARGSLHHGLVSKDAPDDLLSYKWTGEILCLRSNDA